MMKQLINKQEMSAKAQKEKKMSVRTKILINL